LLRGYRGGFEVREHSLKREPGAVLLPANLTLVLRIEVAEIEELRTEPVETTKAKLEGIIPSLS
jgi:hypothetical protein